MTETEPEVQGQGQIDPEEYFNEGFTTGQETATDDLREQIAYQLDDAGFDPDEVDQLLYDPDPAPRRSRKHRRRHTKHAKRYDPAPKRRRRRSKTSRSTVSKKGRGRGRGKTGTKLKGMLGKLKDYVFPAAAGGSFLMQYAARADVLKTAGSITTGGYGGILAAIQWDISHFKAADAMTRVSGNLSTIGVPLVGGYLVKTVGAEMVKGGIGRDVIEIAGDLLMGYGTALGVKKVLDPPVEIVQHSARQTMRHLQQSQIQMQQPQIQQQETYIPWGY